MVNVKPFAIKKFAQHMEYGDFLFILFITFRFSGNIRLRPG